MPTIDPVVEWAMSNSPGFLYRYQPPDIHRARSFLLESNLYATSPKLFNDPLDTLVKFDESGTPMEWAHHHNKLFTKMQPDMPEDERLQRVAMAVDAGLHVEMARESSLALRNSTGIVCLTTKGNDLYMWENYAKKHEGFCLCFKHSPTDPVFGKAIPVQYVAQYPTYRYLHVNVRDVVVELMVTKMEQWKSESEWRIVFMAQPNSLQAFDPHNLKGIVFGCNAKKHFIRKCRALVKKRKNPLKMWLSVKSNDDKEMQLIDF